MSETNTKLLYTVREAAALLSISERKLWTLTNTDELKCVRMGRSVRYSINNLQEFIVKQTSACV